MAYENLFLVVLVISLGHMYIVDT